MKKLSAVALLTMGLSALSMAAEIKGFVMDQACSKMPAMKGDAACAQKCVKGGSPAVLVTDDGKVYKIANQDKVLASVGTTVALTGKVSGDTITVDSVK